MKCPIGYFIAFIIAVTLLSAGINVGVVIEKPVIIERSITPYESLYDGSWIEYRYSINGISCVELLKDEADLKAYKASLREFGRFKGE